MNRTIASAASVTLLVAAACSQEPAVGYHTDVAPILEQRCLKCHLTGGVAPFPLDNYASASAYAVPMKQAVVARTMPPWLASQDCTTYVADESLSEAEIATIAAWVDDGAPEGSPAVEDGKEQGLAGATGLSRVDISIEMTEPYSPRQAPDDYRCFLIDWPRDEPVFVTGFRANPGNLKMVHHVIAYLVQPEEVAEYRRLDAREEGPGYTCFGAPKPGAFSISWLGAWAPGGTGSTFPPGTGLEVLPGSLVALQVHYNADVANGDEFDVTSIDFSVEDEVEKEAFILPFASPYWVGILGPSEMSIAAGDADASAFYAADPTPYMNRITRGRMFDGDSFRIHSAALHMHRLGVTGELHILRPESLQPECMLEIDRWDFDWQRTYAFEEPKPFGPGDELYLECHWDNSGRKHAPGEEPRDVTWGDGTNDEMCLGVLYISET